MARVVDHVIDAQQTFHPGEFGVGHDLFDERLAI